MNFLNSGRLSSISISRTYLLPCCRDVINSPKYALISKEVKSSTQCKQGLLKSICKGHPRLIPALWTQVRFNNKGYPRYHNELNFPNFDPYRKTEFVDIRKTKWGSGDRKPGYTYAVGCLGLVSGAYAAKSIATDLVTFMAAAADVRAMASIEVDLSKVAPGTTSTFKWRGKPLFVKNRTSADMDAEENTPLSTLRHPETPADRCKKPEWLIVIGICTHLGCVPVPNSGDYPGGFYCPCHGSHYDNLGRCRKGPAPLNLEVPPYVFSTDTLIIVG